MHGARVHGASPAFDRHQPLSSPTNLSLSISLSLSNQNVTMNRKLLKQTTEIYFGIPLTQQMDGCTRRQPKQVSRVRQ